MNVLDAFHLKSFNNSFHIGGVLLLAFCISKKLQVSLRKTVRYWSPDGALRTPQMPHCVHSLTKRHSTECGTKMPAMHQNEEEHKSLLKKK